MRKNNEKKMEKQYRIYEKENQETYIMEKIEGQIAEIENINKN